LNGTSCLVRYATDPLHSNVIVAKRRDTTLSAGHLAYDVLVILVIYLFFLVPPAHRHSRLFARTSRTCSLHERYRSAVSRQAEITYALLSERRVVSYGRCIGPMQRARASRVTVTNENTHSLVSWTRGTRHCAFLSSSSPVSPFAALQSMRRNRRYRGCHDVIS